MKDGFLTGDLHAILRELIGNPLLTGVVGGTVHGTRTEVALLLAEEEGTIGGERGAYGLLNGVGSGLLAEVST